MNVKPNCAIENCPNTAFVLFGDKWICGECLAKYDKKLKEENFKRMEELLR